MPPTPLLAISAETNHTVPTAWQASQDIQGGKSNSNSEPLTLANVLLTGSLICLPLVLRPNQDDRERARAAMDRLVRPAAPDLGVLGQRPALSLASHRRYVTLRGQRRLDYHDQELLCQVLSQQDGDATQVIAVRTELNTNGFAHLHLDLSP